MVGCLVIPEHITGAVKIVLNLKIRRRIGYIAEAEGGRIVLNHHKKSEYIEFVQLDLRVFGC